VCDENKKINKDFKCERNVLLSNMKYFDKYIKDKTSFDDIDISVHCDVKVFEWLVKYMEDTSHSPRIEISNSISILISSDFLQMEKLVL
jgi:hypothetical protein